MSPLTSTSLELVNDVHSKLNSTEVYIHRPKGIHEICHLVKTAAMERKCVAICGGRHAMGGQQFSSQNLLIDMREMNRILNLETESGLVTVEAGIQ